MLKKAESLNKGNEDKASNITKIDSKEVLRLVISLLQRKKIAMDYKTIKALLVDDRYTVTEGQILNVQNKVKANKVPELQIIRDKKGHIFLMAGSTSYVVNAIVDSYITKIDSNLKLNLNELTEEDRQVLIAKLNNNTEVLTKMLKTAKQS